jgi:hypothetical protein
VTYYKNNINKAILINFNKTGYDIGVQPYALVDAMPVDQQKKEANSPTQSVT